MIFITEDWPFVCADQEFLGFEFGVSDDLVTGGVPNRELKAYYNITKMAYYQTHARWLRDKQQYLHNIYFYSRPLLNGWDKFEISQVLKKFKFVIPPLILYLFMIHIIARVGLAHRNTRGQVKPWGYPGGGWHAKCTW